VRQKTSSRPSAFAAASGLDASEVPANDAPVVQLPFAAVCHRCHSAPSEPRANTSSRPSALRPSAGSPVTPKVPPGSHPLQPPPGSECSPPPMLAHALQLPFADVCHLWTSAPALVRANSSSRPSALVSAAGSPTSEPSPSSIQPLYQPPPTSWNV